MIDASDLTIWAIIAALGLGTFLIRFSFLGLLGDRELSPWLLRHLRYTAVAVLPALVAPLFAWPEATGRQLDPIWLATAAITLATGYLAKNPIYAIVAGFVCFYGLSALAP